ncbi:MAG: hypothetical protein ACKVP3_04150 [Hyphomicrobiaceae bacterium]
MAARAIAIDNSVAQLFTAASNNRYLVLSPGWLMARREQGPSTKILDFLMFSVHLAATIY